MRHAMKNRKAAIERAVWCMPLLFLLISCAAPPKKESLSWQITFFPLGAKVQFSADAPIRRLQAFNADGVMVGQLNFPVSPRQIESLYFEWRAGDTYRFEVISSTGDVDTQTVTAPRTYTQGSLAIAIPYGTAMEPDEKNAVENDQQALVLHGSEMTATVLVTNGNMPTTFDLELCLPPTLNVIRLPTDWKSESVDTEMCLSTTGRFTIASEVWYRELVLKTSEVPQTGTQAISGVVRFKSAAGKTWEQRTTVQLRLATIPEITERLSIESIEMPTDAAGTADPRQREDTIFYARPLFIKLGTPQTNAYQPTTYQTVQLRNAGEETIHVVVSSTNTDTKRDETIPFLAPPVTVRSVAFASLPGGVVTDIPLPIYFHPMYLKQGQPEQAIPGEYARDITVKVWGSDATLLREKRPLHLIVPNRQALLISLLALLSSGIGFALVLRFHAQIFAGFTTKQLIVIALFGTTVFVAVTVPSALLLNLISAILGPMSVLLTGLINETLYYALLTALLIYINGEPAESTRGGSGSGVILLVSAVRLLLSGVTFGLFTPVAIVYTGTSVLLLETGFLLVRRRNIVAWAVVLGLCDAIAVYVDFQLSILFYRLFYADWYIVLRVLIEGFVYTCIGVLIGAKLGRGLWRVAD